MKNHTLNLGSTSINFKEVDTITDIRYGGIQINGQANSVIEFVQRLRLEEEWVPYGYFLRVIFRLPESKNMTAFLYKK